MSPSSGAGSGAGSSHSSPDAQIVPSEHSMPYPFVLQPAPTHTHAVPSGLVGDPNGWGTSAVERVVAPLPHGKGPPKAKTGDDKDPGGKEKKTRNRKPSSSEHDAEELRAQVARLEAMVQHLTSQKEDSASDTDPPLFPADPSDPSTLSYSPSSTHSPKFVLFPSSSKSVPSSPKPEPYTMDLRANDLCEALSQLAIREFVVVEGSGNEAWAPGGGRGETFLEEARVFMDTLPQRFGLNGTLPGFDGLGEPGWGSTAAGAGANADGPPSSSGAAPESSHNSPTSEYFSMGGSPAASHHSHSLAGLSPGPLGSASFHRAAPPLSDVLKFLPSHELAMSAYEYFCGYVSWYSHPVHLPTFEVQWATLRARVDGGPEMEKDIDPFFVATYLGVLAMGLAMMPVKRAVRDGFVDKDKTVDHWLEGAMVALTCGRFLDNPSVEAVRAVVVISTFFVFLAKGESSGAGMGLLSLSVQVAMSLSLHRDPDRTPSKFTFFEAEERRRLFWNLFMLCILSSASLGRTWSVFDLNGVDTRLPLDCHDVEIVDEALAKAGTEERRRYSEETAMTSLIVKMKLAVMAKKINDAAFGIKPVAYKTILDLDRDLKEFEETIPSRYHLRLDNVGTLYRPTKHVTVTEMRACMIQISLASEFIRIHRPWIGTLLSRFTRDVKKYSRDQAIHYSRLLLAIYRSPSCAKSSYGGLTFKATSAAVVLGIEVLTFPDGSDTASHRAMVRSACFQMETHKDSSLARKGARILRFLLEKDTLLATQREHDRSTKRQRTRVAQAPVAFPSRLREAFQAPRPESPPLSEEDDLPHCRPAPRSSVPPPTPPIHDYAAAPSPPFDFTRDFAPSPSVNSSLGPSSPSSSSTSSYQPLDFGSTLPNEFDFSFLPMPAYPASYESHGAAYYTLPGSSAYTHNNSAPLARLAAFALLVSATVASPTPRLTARTSKSTPMGLPSRPDFIPLAAIHRKFNMTAIVARELVEQVATNLDVVKRTQVDLLGTDGSLEDWSDVETRGVKNVLTNLQLAISLTCVDSSSNDTYITSLFGYGGAGTIVYLCPGAVIKTTNPIFFTDANQTLATKGYPTGSTRATVLVTGADQSCAIIGGGGDNVALRNIQVDGGRETYGLIDGGIALLEFGGDSTGQIIDRVHAFEPRGWSCLHAIEGTNNDCSAMKITNNDIGPSGHAPSGVDQFKRDNTGTYGPGQWADGISLACQGSTVSGNTITDATDGAIVIFGAPGSLITGNTIISQNRQLLGGINMVDYGPFGGSYAGTVVSKNTVWAKGSMIKVGIPMGGMVWGVDNRTDSRTSGGTVTGNSFLASGTGFFGYAIGAAGHNGAVVSGNQARRSSFGGVPSPSCFPQWPLPAPQAFIRDPNTTPGTWQTGFNAQSTLVLLICKGPGPLPERAMDRLPPELLLRIAELRIAPLWAYPRYEALKTLALVSRAWRSPSQALLHTYVFIKTPRSANALLRGQERGQFYTETLDIVGNSHLGFSETEDVVRSRVGVRSLRVRAFSQFYEDVLYVSSLSELLSLSLEDTLQIVPSRSPTFRHPFSLTSLTIKSLSHVPPSLIASLFLSSPRLENLTLTVHEGHFELLLSIEASFPSVAPTLLNLTTSFLTPTMLRCVGRLETLTHTAEMGDGTLEDARASRSMRSYSAPGLRQMHSEFATCWDRGLDYYIRWCYSSSMDQLCKFPLSLAPFAAPC
ncbi:hypothetical protein RQP46_006695 [Phenoliferia psychrophenolica]